ncbi:hypothetical protein N7488_000204 [Penicillium malachiteum]|nr:hypothetical protein N7488_000204 [Penicillium malachiteum]
MYQSIAKLDAIEEGIAKLVAGQQNTFKLMEDMVRRKQARLICAAAKMESHIEREIQATDMSWPADHSWAMAFRRTQERNRAKHEQRSFQYFSHLLNKVLYASFYASTGAGGFSLAPMLKIQAVYTDESWQYQMMSKFDLLGQKIVSSSLALEISESIIHEFQVAFLEGKASPSDTCMLDWWGSESISLIDSNSYFHADILILVSVEVKLLVFTERPGSSESAAPSQMTAQNLEY